MRNVLICISAGVVLLFGCSHADLSAPQPAGIEQVDQRRSGVSPSHVPKNFRILYSFQDGADGADPTGDLFRDAAGNLYGAAYGSQYRYGILFKVDTSGNETVLHVFDPGYGFYGDVLEDPAGDLLGNTPSVVFKLGPNGNYTVLHSFAGGTDGSMANPGMVLDKAGNLYGVTEFGGGSDEGVVFKIDPAGRETVLHNLNHGFGDESRGGLIADTAGNLFGTTRIGGRYGAGVVFEIHCAAQSASDCTSGSTVHSFNGIFHHPPPFHTNDGDEPVSRLVMDSAGSMYGTAELGGLGDGVIFKIDPNGHERVLFNFNGNDGKFPTNDLAVDDAGNVFGTGDAGAYMVDSRGFFAVLHSFVSGGPTSSLIRDSAGNLYGVGYGGPSGHGFVYELSP